MSPAAANPVRQFDDRFDADRTPVSHNLLGQRLGRKGRDTRERILAAADALLLAPAETPFTLSAVAREASLGMTTLYLYFSDLPALLHAVLDRIMASAEASYVARLRTYWPDVTLGDDCRGFVVAFHGFWHRHARVLHLRNALADARDERMLAHRIQVSYPLIRLIVRQMGLDPAEASPGVVAAATVLLTGVERVVTMATDTRLPRTDDHLGWTLGAQGRLLALGIADVRGTPTA